MNVHHQQDDTTGLVTLIVRCLIGMLILAALAAAIFIFTGCAYTITPDGARSFTLDGPGAVRAIEIIAEK